MGLVMKKKIALVCLWSSSVLAWAGQEDQFLVESLRAVGPLPAVLPSVAPARDFVEPREEGMDQREDADAGLFFLGRLSPEPQLGGALGSRLSLEDFGAEPAEFEVDAGQAAPARTFSSCFDQDFGLGAVLQLHQAALPSSAAGGGSSGPGHEVFLCYPDAVGKLAFTDGRRLFFLDRHQTEAMHQLLEDHFDHDEKHREQLGEVSVVADHHSRWDPEVSNVLILKPEVLDLLIQICGP
jgi:hypothetical protein